MVKQNPTFRFGNGAGTCKTIEDATKLASNSDIGIIVIGSLMKAKRPGNDGDVWYESEDKKTTLNSLGIPCGGIEYYEKNLPQMIQIIHDAGKQAIVNIAGDTEEEYVELAILAFKCGADGVEVNCGCPNLWREGHQKKILTYNLPQLKQIFWNILQRCISLNLGRTLKFSLKFSPIFDRSYLEEICEYLNRLREQLPPEIQLAVTTMNTVPNCYIVANGKPAITPGGGLAGMAGSVVFPIALGQVKQFREFLNPAIEIFGVGGVTNGNALRLMFETGADYVQATSAYYATENPGVFTEILQECHDLAPNVIEKAMMTS